MFSIYTIRGNKEWGYTVSCFRTNLDEEGLDKEITRIKNFKNRTCKYCYIKTSDKEKFLARVEAANKKIFDSWKIQAPKRKVDISAYKEIMEERKF